MSKVAPADPIEMPKLKSGKRVLPPPMLSDAEIARQASREPAGTLVPQSIAYKSLVGAVVHQPTPEEIAKADSDAKDAVRVASLPVVSKRKYVRKSILPAVAEEKKD